MKEFDELIALMARLRGEYGCPWDRLQTTDSLKPMLLEEVYEVIEAIERGTRDALREELGDLLLHVVFMARICEEEGSFDIRDVVQGLSEKLYRRHPHVFGDVTVSAAREVEATWAKVKRDEKPRESLMDGVPCHLPALMRAYRLTRRAARVGFDWEDSEAVWVKLQEELQEFHAALKENNSQRVHDEFGDILFTLVNCARFLGVEPEGALRGATDRFADRFRYIEECLDAQGKSVADTSLVEMDRLWEESKGKTSA